MAELALDDVEGNALPRQLERVGVAELVGANLLLIPTSTATRRNSTLTPAAFQGRPLVGPSITQNRGPAASFARSESDLAHHGDDLLDRRRVGRVAHPRFTRSMSRRLEVRAGAPSLKGTPTGVFATRQRMRAAERELAAQAEAAYRRSVRDWHATQAKPKAKGAGGDTGTRI